MADLAAPPPPSVARPEAPERAGLIPPYPVFACSAVFYWSISIRSLLYTLMPTVAADLGLSSSLAGAVIAAITLGYCASSWAAGWLPGSRKARILGGIILSIPGAVLFSMAGNVWVMFVGALALGLGVGVYLPLGLVLLVDVGGRGRRARYLAVQEVAASLASFSGATYVAVILARTDWRGSVLAWCTVGVLALVAFAALRDRKDTRSRRRLSQSVPVDRTLVYSAFSFGAVTLLLMGLTSVLPLIMVRAWGLSQAHAASVVGYTRLAGLVGIAIAGLLADRVGPVRVTLALEAVSLVGAVAMALDGFSPLFVAGIVMLAIGSAGTVNLIPIIIAGAYSPAQRERAMAVSGSVGGLLGMVATPALFGVLIDANLPTGPILLSAVATVGAIVVTSQLRRTVD